MVQLTESRIDGALSKIETGLKRYCWIQENIHGRDVSRDRSFQNKFNGFYKVRRNDAWQLHFYTLLEMSKGTGITFPNGLCTLLERTSRVEASFASKLVATLHPDKPVIDEFVLSNFGLRLPSGKDRERRCVGCIVVYDQLCDNYVALIKSAEGLMICEKFKRSFPWADITDLKKVDLVLWQIRDAK